MLLLLLPQDPPEIYMAVDGKIILEDELLNFLIMKMKTLSQDDIILLAMSHFGSEWIESSKKVFLNFVQAL